MVLISQVRFGNENRRLANANRGSGFALVELMVVTLIVGILVAIAIPVLRAASATAQTRTCFANQRSIESAAAIWRVDSATAVPAGVVNEGHVLMNPKYLKRPPRCPSAPPAADTDNPTSAEGAYSIDASGNVEPCGFGGPTHGSFRGP